MGKLQQIKMAFGGQTSPNVLTSEQISTLLSVIADNSIDADKKQFSGYVRLNSGTITEYQKHILAQNNISFLGDVTADEFTLSASKTTISTNDAVTLSVSGSVGSVVYEVQSASVTDGEVTDSQLQALLSVTGDTLTISPLRATFAGSIVIKAYPAYDPTNAKTVSLTLTNIIPTAMSIEGETLIETATSGSLVKHYTFAYAPSGYTMRPAIPVVNSNNASQVTISDVTVDGFTATFLCNKDYSVTLSATTEGMSDTCQVTVKNVAPVAFEDEAVKNILLNKGVDTNEDGEITEGELASVTDISDWFWQNTEITKFDELGITSVTEILFNGCRNLTSVIIPNTVTSFTDKAFMSCEKLTSINIPNTVVHIGAFAFDDCNSLTHITIPDSVLYLGHDTFVGSDNLTSVHLPNQLVFIPSDCFYQCKKLTTVNIPEGVTTIYKMAFYQCTSLVSIVLPNSLNSIHYEVFRECTSLVSITIPNSITVIDTRTFYHCSSLETVTLPNSLIEISTSAFQGCTSLREVTIPASITSIKGNAFAYCTALKVVTILAETPPSVGSDAFYTSVSGLKIRVPAASVDAYKVAEGWSGYASKIVAIDD